MASPIVWPLSDASHMIETRIQIPSTAGPGESGHGGGHRRSQTNSLGGGLLRRMGQHFASKLEERRKDALGAKQGALLRSSAAPSHSPSAGAKKGTGAGLAQRPVDPTPHPSYTDPVVIDPVSGEEDGLHDYISVWLMEMKDDAWKTAEHQTFDALEASAVTKTKVMTMAVCCSARLSLHDNHKFPLVSGDSFCGSSRSLFWRPSIQPCSLFLSLSPP